MTWYQIKNNIILITIWAKPNAKKTQFSGLDDRGIHISIHAKPDEGKANKALIDFLAKQIGVAKSQIELIKGKTGRSKQVTLPYDDQIINNLADIDADLKNTAN